MTKIATALSIDPKLLAEGKKYAKRNRMSFAALVEKLLLAEMPEFRFDDEGQPAKGDDPKVLLEEAQRLLAHASKLQGANTIPAPRKPLQAAPKRKPAGRA